MNKENAQVLDVYAEAVSYLTAHPDQIPLAWDEPFDHPAGVLFRPVAPYEVESVRPHRPDGKVCGCLTVVRCGTDPQGIDCVAWTDELTAAIREDPRIPRSDEEITVPSLPVFAEWQRRVDQELGRKTLIYFMVEKS